MRTAIRRPSAYLAVALVVAVVASGCGPDEEAVDESAWTVERDALRLEEDLRVSEADTFFVGSADDVAVGPGGRMYVADAEAVHVKVLAPDGSLVAVIGSEGEGPGEFRRPEQVVVGRGDSLYVLDGYWGRASVFSPDHAFAYAFSLRSDEGSPARMMVLEEDGYAVVQNPRSMTLAREDVPAVVRRVGADRVVGDTLAETPPYQMVTEEIERGMSFYVLPYARRSHARLGPDGRVHVAYGDSLAVRVYDLEGLVRDTVAVPFEAVPVTEEDVERELELFDAEGRALVGPEIADTKPAFTSFLVDDRGRYWFKRPTADHQVADWWVVDAEARRVQTASLPSGVTFTQVRGDYAYGSAGGGDAAPAVVRYHIGSGR